MEACGLSCRVELVGVDEEDWANRWKQFYKPLHIGRHLLILPPWEKCDIKEDDVVVLMDPGMAFGTGATNNKALA